MNDPIAPTPAIAHPSSIRRWSWLGLATALLLFPRPAAQAADRVFRAGAFAVDITPTNFPVIVNGGFLASTATQVREPLHVRCLVLDDGETRVGLGIIDTCLIPRDLADQAKALIHDATGLPPERVLLAATHTHFAPSLMQALGTPPDPHYPAFLLPRLVEAFRGAVDRLTPARIGWGQAPAPDHTHTRTWIRRPDRVDTDPFGERTVRANMHPGHRNPDAIGPSGPPDPDLSVIAIQTRDERPLALLANYAMHYHGGSGPVSSDYFGLFAEKIHRLVDPAGSAPGFVGIMSQGFSGDQHWMDYSQPARAISMDRYAEDLAQRAHEICQTIQYQDWVPLAMRDRDLPLPVRMPGPERLAWAREKVTSTGDRLPQNIPEVYAREQLWLEENPIVNVKLQALRLGELGLTAVSGEVFAITSLKLKAQSPLPMLVNFELANGEDGYVPPPEVHKLGGYNTWACRTACLEEQAEPKIVDTLLGMLEEVAGQPRRPINVSHGLYAQSVLLAEPLAYWRMEEFVAPLARDATRHQRTARYEDGVVFYLDGPASPTFSGAQADNRAPHFAGGRMVAPLPHPGEQVSVELWFWNGLPARIRGVTGYLFDWGDRLAIGGTNEAAGCLVLSSAGHDRTLTGTTSLPLKQWTHVAFTRDRSEVVVYVNGQPEIMGELPPPRAADAASLYLGGAREPAHSFEGKLDEVAVFDRALGAAEVLRRVQLAALEVSGTVLVKVAPDPLGAYSHALQGTRPLAYWRLGENGFGGRQALDSTPAARHAIYEEDIELYDLGMPAPAFTSGQATNHAARFAGGRLRGLVKGLGSTYSVSFWFCNDRPNNVAPVTGYLFSRGPDAADGAPGDHLGIGGTHMDHLGRLIIYNGNALGQVLAGRTVVRPGTWNHVTLVRAGRKVQVYLNGEPDFAGEIDVSPAAAAEELFLGGRNDNFANFSGRIDEAAVHARALSAEEVRCLYATALNPPAAAGASNPSTQ
jgi:hypothetical protein